MNDLLMWLIQCHQATSVTTSLLPSSTVVTITSIPTIFDVNVPQNVDVNVPQNSFASFVMPLIAFIVPLVFVLI